MPNWVVSLGLCGKTRPRCDTGLTPGAAEPIRFVGVCSASGGQGQDAAHRESRGRPIPPCRALGAASIGWWGVPVRHPDSGRQRCQSGCRVRNEQAPFPRTHFKQHAVAACKGRAPAVLTWNAGIGLRTCSARHASVAANDGPDSAAGGGGKLQPAAGSSRCPHRNSGRE